MEIRMSKLSIGVPETQLANPLEHKRRFPKTTARRSLTSGAFAEIKAGGSSTPNLARVAVEEHAAVIGEKPETPTVRDVMSADVISASANTSVQEIAEIMSRNRISSVPVVDSTGRLLGLVSDADLIRRVEIGTEPRRSWWHAIFYNAIAASYDYVRSHGRKARDVMTLHPLVTSADEPLHKAANRMARRGLRRMPVVCDDRVVGMLSRSDIVEMLASRSTAGVASRHPANNDDAVREDLVARIHSLPWNMSMRVVNATVNNGIARIYGWVASDVERRALQVVAENTPGVSEVRDHLQRARLFI
jgi:CBS domain-containing protein